jgi:hypothetical protein
MFLAPSPLSNGSPKRRYLYESVFFTAKNRKGAKATTLAFAPFALLRGIANFNPRSDIKFGEGNYGDDKYLT